MFKPHNDPVRMSGKFPYLHKRDKKQRPKEITEFCWG